MQEEKQTPEWKSREGSSQLAFVFVVPFFPLKPYNVRDHRARTIILQAEKHARKPGFACIALLCGDWPLRDRLPFVQLTDNFVQQQFKLWFEWFNLRDGRINVAAFHCAMRVKVGNFAKTVL